MATAKYIVLRFWTDESGQDLIEYTLIAALIGLGAVASTSSLANSIGSTITSIGTSLTSSI
jgi:pilus assembly protein Flp/PilA